MKYTEATVSNSTRKLLWFEITKMPIAFKKKIYSVIYDKFRHTFVPYTAKTVCLRTGQLKKLLTNFHEDWRR